MTKERAKNVFGKTLSYWENKVYTECVINLLCIILSFFWQQMGAYHTIDLELNRKFTLIKEYWDIIALERVGKLNWKFNLFINSYLAYR